MSKIKAIIFDWHNTLSNSVFWEHLEVENKESFDEIRNQFLDKENKDILRSWMRGSINSRQAIEYLTKNLNKISFFEEELNKSCKNMRFYYKGIENVFEKLKSKGIQLNLATDNMDVFTKYTVPALKLDKYFDNILSSHNIGFLKSDLINNKPVFFDNFFQNNSIQLEEYLFIDDSEKINTIYSKTKINMEMISNKSEIVSIINKYIDFD